MANLPVSLLNTATKGTRRRVLNKPFSRFVAFPATPLPTASRNWKKCKGMEEGWPLFCLLPTSDQKAWLGRLVDQKLASIISRPSIVLGPFGPLKLLSQNLVLDSGAFIPVYVNYFEHKIPSLCIHGRRGITHAFCTHKKKHSFALWAVMMRLTLQPSMTFVSYCLHMGCSITSVGISYLPLFTTPFN